jgi:hypothetical protein
MSPLGAQVVRGTVRDARTQGPVSAAIVSLEDAELSDRTAARLGSSLALTTLSDETGQFSVSAPHAGRYVITIKRVGLQRFQSDAFTLGAGETRRVDAILEPIDFTVTLPRVAITADTPCATRPDQAARVAALWDEVRSALTGTRLAVRDRTFRATIVAWTRLLAPVSLRIQKEDQRVRRGVTDRPFHAPDAASLSEKGYVQREGNGDNVYFAPDAEVLASREFLRDHCFALSNERRRRPGLVGLSFDPVRSRRLPDVRGSFWMDSSTHELRTLEFSYANVPDTISRGGAHGEIHYAMSPRGTWYVSKWFIRTPEYGRSERSSGVPGGTQVELLRYKEDGGDVTVEGTGNTARAAKLTGRVTDSTSRRSLIGAVVSLAGTRYRAAVRSDGYFVLDSLPGGAFTLVVEYPGYAALGVSAGEQELELAEGSQSVSAVQALGTEQLLRRLCGRNTFAEDRSVLRIAVTDSAGSPLVGAAVRVGFDTFSTSAGGITTRPQLLETEADDRGAALFCDVPARTTLRIEAELQGRTQPVRQSITLPPGTITPLVLRAVR